MGKIRDSHDELFHYTTAAGLSGILESKCLWATHTSFLNDQEEIIYFYNRVLPKILEPIFMKYMEDMKESPEFQRLRGSKAFKPCCEDRFGRLINTIRERASQWHDYYVTSFSTSTDLRVREHGLLSQWRAYGVDGGYALVFDRNSLHKIVVEEVTPYEDETHSWGDVQYGLKESRRTDDPFIDEKIEELELESGKFFRLNATEHASKTSELLTILSCFFKHRGFAEEKEVRMVLCLLGPDLESHPELQSARQHPIKTTVRGGATVPVVELCIREANGIREHLPITRIIVGPHRDKDDRKRAVKLLLKQHGLTADVSLSDIPYRGR